MFIISCFADEISSDLYEQINVMKGNNVKYVELRSVWDKNVLNLSDEELDTIKQEFSRNGIKVSSIGSPIGKVNIKDDFADHLIRFKRAVEVAEKMESRYIRIFSFYMDKKDMDMYENEVTDRLKQMLEIAKENNLILLHENEANIYGESSINCLKLFNTLDDVCFKAVFDPSNFVVAGEEVLDESFNKLKEHVEYIHVKDSKKGTGEIVIAGNGDGHLREIFDKLRDKKDMFVSLEPHLAQAGKYKGFTGPELFEKDLGALRQLLEELKIDFM